MVKTLAGIVPSIPLELGFCSLQISHTSCCPFFVRVPPITTMGGYAGSCPSFLRVLPIADMGGYAGSCPSFPRVLPITGMGGCPGRCPFGLRVLPITGMGGRPSRLRVLPITGMGGRPFRLRVLPITGMGGRPGRCPMFLRVLPVIITGRLPFFPLTVSQVVLLVLRSFLSDITHIAFDVKCSTTTPTDPRNQICKLQRSITILTFSIYEVLNHVLS